MSQDACDYITIISIYPVGTLDRPMLQPRVVEFSKVTAKFFLQQTKPLWLNLEMSRQDGKSCILIICTYINTHNYYLHSYHISTFSYYNVIGQTDWGMN